MGLKGARVLAAAAAAAAVGAAASEQKIQHVVVVMMENRAYDHVLGWSSSLGANGLTGAECNYLDLETKTGQLCVTDDAININVCDPDHQVTATTFKLFGGSDDKVETGVLMNGFAAYEAAKENAAENRYCSVMSGFKPEDLPVINNLAAEYAVLDNLFASVPGPTWPNRLMALTGTAMGADGDIWYQNVPGQFYPQKTFYQQLDESGLSWKNYYNDTPWECMIEYIAERPEQSQPMDAFFHDCEHGTLPSFAWINPRTGINATTGVGSNDFHPTHDAYAAEEFYKSVYEAVRASPLWNNTLMIITFDEHGGFYDHVATPNEGVPAPEAALKDYTDDTAYFDFNRLGVRIPTVAISPWIPKGTVVHEPPKRNKPTATSQYDLTSLMATVRKLFPDMTQEALTNRDAWASTFDYVFDSLSEPRSDCPMHAPDALTPTPADDSAGLTSNQALHNEAPLIDIQEDIARVHAHLAGVELPPYRDQKTHAAWLTQHYQKHQTLTQHHRAHVASQASALSPYSVEMVLKGNPEAGAVDGQWDINGILHGGNAMYASANSRFHTVSTRRLQYEVASGEETLSGAYCLDAGSGVEGSQLTISPCLPSQDPVYNRVAAQHFYYTKEGNLKYYSDSAPMDEWLCVTSSNPDADDATAPLYLAQCDHSALQSWAYNGYAPGNGGDGAIASGVHFIGVRGGPSASTTYTQSSDWLAKGKIVTIVTSIAGALCMVVVVVALSRPGATNLLPSFTSNENVNAGDLAYDLAMDSSRGSHFQPDTAIDISNRK